MPHHLRLARSGLEQAAQHLEGSGFAGAIGPKQAEDFTLLHFEADVVGGREFAEALGEIAARHRNVGTQLDRRQALGELRCTAGAAAEKIDEGVFEAGRHLGQAHLGLIRQQLYVLHGRALAQHHADTSALNHTIADAGQIQDFRQDCSAFGADIFKTEAPAFELRGQLLRWAVEEQLAFVEQKHAFATLGLVQIGGGPDHRHALIGQGLHHAPQILAADRVHPDSRLVQQQHLGSRHERTGKAELLFHAAGELAGQALGEGREAREI